MLVVDDPEAAPEIFADFQSIIDTTADHKAPLARLERFAFYERAREAFVIVQTGETRLYGNVMLKKGVIS